MQSPVHSTQSLNKGYNSFKMFISLPVWQKLIAAQKLLMWCDIDLIL